MPLENLIGTGLLHREQWADSGDRERSAVRKKRCRNSLPTPTTSTESPDLGSCVLVVTPTSRDARLVDHTGQVAARVKRLGRGSAPSGSSMAHPIGYLAGTFKV